MAYNLGAHARARPEDVCTVGAIGPWLRAVHSDSEAEVSRAHTPTILALAGLLALCARAETDDAGERRRVQALYDHHEQQCLHKGWQKLIVEVAGRKRQLMWRGPKGSWEHGAIVALHGGGGTFSNFGSNLAIGRPMVQFADLAVERGFAVFSPDSTWDVVTDARGRPCGKRWDCTAQEGRDNVDVPFIRKVISEVIPGQRPAHSATAVCLAGISNGGFMTILAATHLPDQVTAFAAVSAGDPYGTHMDMGTTTLLRRTAAPGVFRDNETGKLISAPGAAAAKDYPNEARWPSPQCERKPAFKQFHHQGDAGVDISCMEKARTLLVEHGYRDAGPFIVRDAGRKALWKHFWLGRYNRPLLDFFAQCVREARQ